MTIDFREFVEFAPQARFHVLERSGSFEYLRNFWT
jgi:hypothetical protein